MKKTVEFVPPGELAQWGTTKRSAGWPEQAFFIGDTIADRNAAQALGIR